MLSPRAVHLARALANVPPQYANADKIQFLECIHYPHVHVRATPSVSGEILGSVACGEAVGIEAVEIVNNAHWARLCAAERNNLIVNYSRPELQPAEAWMLIDGAAVGLGQLHRLLSFAQYPPLRVWELAHRLYIASWEARTDRICRVGLPGRVRYARLMPDAAAEHKRAIADALHRLQGQREASSGDSGGGDRDAMTDEATLRDRMSTDKQYLSCWLPVEDENCLERVGSASVVAKAAAAAEGNTGKDKDERRQRWGSLLGTDNGRNPFPEASPGNSADWSASVVAESARPRLCIALLLRGAPAGCVAGFIAYHLAVGFERIYLYFDDIAESDAIAAARLFERRGVVITLCTSSYWQQQRETNCFFTDSRSWCQGINPTNFEKGDVQSRQCVVVQDAMELAGTAGFDWLLHIDIDELWYSPVPDAQQDAPRVFATAPEYVTELVFHNHEAVAQMEDSPCWFTSHTLFKVHSAFTRSPEENVAHEERCKRLHERADKDEREAEEAKAQRLGTRHGGGEVLKNPIELELKRSATPNSTREGGAVESTDGEAGAKDSDDDMLEDEDDKQMEEESWLRWLNDPELAADEMADGKDAFNIRIAALAVRHSGILTFTAVHNCTPNICPSAHLSPYQLSCCSSLTCRSVSVRIV